MSDLVLEQANLASVDEVVVQPANAMGVNEPTTDETRTWSRSDVVGISLSVLCAIHCAATPLLIAALPTLGLTWFEAPWVHQAMFAGCLLLAGSAVLRGYRVHRRSLVPGVAMGGLALLAASAFVFPAPCCAAAATDDANGVDACGHSGCAHCAVAASKNNAVDDATDATSSTLSAGSSSSTDSSWTEWSLTEWWLRLMTPIGGFLLVVAHSLNIKWVRSCQCGCCPT